MHADSKQGRTRGTSRNHIRIWAIYALAFLTPLMYRGSAEAARALGFGAIAQLTVAYLAFAASGLTTWALVTRSPWAPIIAPITPPATPGLPNDLRNPLILLCAVSAVIATGLFVGPFGKDATSLPESASFAYRLILGMGAALVVPVAEELGGRWLLYRGLRPAHANSLAPRQRFRATAPAMLTSGAAFGLFHYMVAGPTRMAITAIVGVILAASYEWSGTLTVPIAVHIYINANARFTTEFGSEARYLGIILVIGLGLRAITALARIRPRRTETP